MIRLIPHPGEPIDPDELHDMTGLIQSRIDGRISRRAMIERALKIGISAPVVGVMLHATSDMAFGAPSNGRNATLARLQEGQTVAVTGPTQPAGTMQEGGTIVAGGPALAAQREAVAVDPRRAAAAECRVGDFSRPLPAIGDERQRHLHRPLRTRGSRRRQGGG